MGFVLRFLVVAAITGCLLYYVPDGWKKYNALLLAGYMVLVGIVFLCGRF